MKIHCIGIGGIGVSALAQYCLSQEYKVSGSDLAASEITEFLADKGVEIMIGNRAEHISQDIDRVIYSPAVQLENPEFKKARELGIALQSYPQALGELTKNYFTIAVCGSHGKSTTTALVALILQAGGLDPTVIIGTKLNELGGTNFRAGNSKYLVIEACEYDGSFLNYSPSIIVLTNIDKEHLDYFKTFANVKKAFKEFVSKLPKDGVLVVNRDDKNSKFKYHNAKSKFKIQNYNLQQPEEKHLKKILQIPGAHNVSNALAALSVARLLEIPDAVSLKSLSEYQGSWRRFQIIKTKPYTLISDYGHHPNEVLATLQAAREKYPTKIIWLIFRANP